VKDGKAINLELIVTVYNVKKGYNSSIMKKSPTLSEYAVFVDKVETYRDKKLEKTEAMNRAVAECIRENILKEFLLRNGGEIVSILNMEWNFDDAVRVRAAEEAEKMAEKIAEEMLLENEPMNKIIKYTKLTEEKILEIKKKLKI
jgi:hypothetical protein